MKAPDRTVKGSTAWFRYYYWLLKRRAKQRKRGFRLTFERFKELKSKEKCPYCNRKMQVVTIDRINNRLGYSDKNCIAVCWECNRLKGQYLTPEEVKMLARAFSRVRKRLPNMKMNCSVYL